MNQNQRLSLSQCALLTPADEEAESLAIQCAAAGTPACIDLFRRLTPEHFVHAGRRKRFLFLRDRVVAGEWPNTDKIWHGIVAPPKSVNPLDVLRRLRHSLLLRNQWALAMQILGGVKNGAAIQNEKSIQDYQLAAEGRGGGA